MREDAKDASRPVATAHAWVLACRPKTLTAAAAPVAIGAGLAHAHHRFVLLPALAALAGALLIQIGTNLANDYYDFMKGGDREGRLGPLRVTQAGLIEPRAVLRGAILAFALAVGVGIYLAAVAGWPVVAIGVASVASGIAYTAGPYPLAYHALGDVFAFFFFGLVAVAGTYYVQALSLAPDALLAGAALGAATTAILVVNNLRDIDTDARAGKRTLAVMIGRRWTQVEYVALVLATVVVPLLGIVLFDWTAWVLLSVGAFPVVFPAMGLVLTDTEPASLNRGLAVTARFVGLFGLLLGLGFALG